MNQSTKGEIRPQSVPNRPTHETLIGVLAELEAAADLVEQLLTHGHDEAVLATITQSLAEMLALLGGGRHG